MAAKRINGTGEESEPLIDDDTLDPMVRSALRDATLRQVVSVVRDNADIFSPPAITELRILRSEQRRNQLLNVIEDMPVASNSHGRAKALQLIRAYADVQHASPGERIAMLGGRHQHNVLPPIQRLVMLDDPATDNGMLKRLN